MIISDSSNICEKASIYYYEYLDEQTKRSIPVKISDHISRCSYCQSELERLKVLLNKRQIDRSSGAINDYIATKVKVMELHFSCVATPISCNIAKPFLPALSDTSLTVNIPTPIMVHLDKCHQCAEDLSKIQKLNLNHTQLCRLGQLFAEKEPDKYIGFSRIQPAIEAIVAMDINKVNPQILKHICICRNCRKLLFNVRKKFYGKLMHNKELPDETICDKVMMTDIFDYSVPYISELPKELLNKSLRQHIKNCPRCFDKIQKLHKVVFDIYERPESGIVTSLKVEQQDKTKSESKSDDIYAGFPVSVEVLGRQNSVSLQQTPVQAKSKFFQLNPAPLAKIVAAAAIFVFFASIFLFNAPTAKAVGLGHIYKALEHIKNVHISRFFSGESEPIQEILISQELNLKMFKTKAQHILWDLKNRSRKSKDLNIDSIETTKLSDDIIIDIEQTMRAPWGLLPFDDISVVPQDAEWQLIPSNSHKTTVANTEVYDLCWVEKEVGGFLIYKKWRGYINTETRLPVRIEWWRKRAEQDEYELRNITEVFYPDTVVIQANVDNFGF